MTGNNRWSPAFAERFNAGAMNHYRSCGNAPGMMSNLAKNACRAMSLLGAAATLSACAPGSGDGLNVSGRPLSEGGDVPLAATLESIQVNVFDASCTVCHSGAAAPLGLRLDANDSFVSLVGTPSRQVSSLLRVEPGNPDRSYLIRKLEGTAAEGDPMPLGGPPLPQATIDFVRQWILDGAPPASGTSPGRSPVIISMTPAPGFSGPEFPAQIDVGFDREIDASTVSDLSFTLVRSGGDDQFGDAGDVRVQPTSVGLSALNPRLAVMDLAGVTAVEDLYRVTVAGSGANIVLGIDGLALDGEFSGAFPSGDGNEGGNFVAGFEVQGLQASLDSIQANVLAPTCAVSGCHSGPSGPNLPGGMDLTTADNSFNNLVNLPSVQIPALQRVTPGDADASYLVQKLEGTAAGGQRMPLAGPPLDQATIDVIRAWIDNGANR